MKQKKVHLVIYGKTSNGWLRGAIIAGKKNGTVKHGWMLVNGKEVEVNPFDYYNYSYSYTAAQVPMLGTYQLVVTAVSNGTTFTVEDDVVVQVLSV